MNALPAPASPLDELRTELAAENLFVVHLVGDGVEADPERAAHWMRRAQEEGVDAADVLEGLGPDPAQTLREHGLTPVS